MKQPLYIASDHAGFALKEYLKDQLHDDYDMIDCGPDIYNKDDDYPAYAKKVAEMVRDHKARGVLICDTGIGMSIAANRVEGVRAALVTTPFMAERSRLHNDANIVVLGSDVADKQTNEALLRTWLQTDFSGAERHIRRLNEIDAASE